MPVLRARYGQDVWWSDRCTPKPDELLIRADAPPMEELWRLLRIACLIRIAWSKAWSYNYDDMEDLQQTTYVATYNELLRRIREGIYDRRVPLYLNLRSCCWAVYQHNLDSWMERIRRRLNTVDAWATVGHDDSVGHGNDMCIYDKIPNGFVRLITDSDVRDYSKHLSWKTMTRKRDQHVRLKKDMQEQYELYCESCMELGTEPMQYDDFLANNLTKEEMSILHYKPSKHALYNRKYWEKHKIDPVWLAKRHESVLRSQKKNAAVRETHKSDDGQ